jgi:F-type H+-transporting ATPase subunit a
MWGGITVATVLASVALSVLELFVAFLQAYVFTFLTALFMGMNMNPEH